MTTTKAPVGEAICIAQMIAGPKAKAKAMARILDRILNDGSRHVASGAKHFRACAEFREAKRDQLGISLAGKTVLQGG